MFTYNRLFKQIVHYRDCLPTNIIRIKRFNSTIGANLDGQTIFSLSSGMDHAGIAVIRISGNDAQNVIPKMTNKVLESIKPRYTYYSNIVHPQTKKLLDKGVIIYHPAPKSFTGENVVELQVHGGPAVISSILNALGTFPNFRQARAGEFTRRGFLNEKFDLTEVEALGDLLQAETEKQREQAIAGYTGTITSLCSQWRTTLINCLGYIETLIDFSDNTDDLDEKQYQQHGKQLEILYKEIQGYTNNYEKSEMIRAGIYLPIFGAPNAGKSSLLNLLVHSERAIVSPYAGTTRDIVEAIGCIEGFKVIYQDTAGIRNTNNEIEKVGIEKALSVVQSNHLKIYIIDVQDILHDSSVLREFKRYIDNQTIVVVNKIDLVEDKEELSSLLSSLKVQLNCKDVLSLSCLQKPSIDRLESIIYKSIMDEYQMNSEDHSIDTNQYILNQRQNNDLKQCLNHIQSSIHIYNDNMVDAVAEELRLALGCLARITGKVDIEEILDSIFSKFCIGK
ncbi:hypothetical protein WA158_007414 [Blastocystis sp. Blastoise]